MDFLHLLGGKVNYAFTWIHFTEDKAIPLKAIYWEQHWETKAPSAQFLGFVSPVRRPGCWRRHLLETKLWRQVNGNFCIGTSSEGSLKGQVRTRNLRHLVVSLLQSSPILISTFQVLALFMPYKIHWSQARSSYRLQSPKPSIISVYKGDFQWSSDQ